ncbi:MAG: hypothetical protein HAW67_01785 [Endozoicomonadaceae bacterium]|nr:hypothetical protein [Endozoicomonadaceae bacterium]
MNVKTGVTNPYALSEILLGKKINWNSFTNPQEKLSEILTIPVEKIFDLNNPILSPSIKIKENGELIKFNDTEIRKRLDIFLDKGMNDINPISFFRTNDMGVFPSFDFDVKRENKVLPFNSQTLSNTFSALALTKSSKNKPWQPTDKVWIDKGDYFEDVAELNDPIQGYLGDCYFIAALSSVAWARPYVIVNMVRPSGWGNEESPIHRTLFYKNGSGSAQAVDVSEKVPVSKTSHGWVYAKSLDSNEIWPAVMEKAYAKWKTGNTTDYPNYAPIAGGDPVMSCAELIRGRRTYKSNSQFSANNLWSFVRSHSLSRRTINPMVAWTSKNYPNAKVVGGHAYSVLGWDYYKGEKYIVLRNPWGTHHATLDTRSGKWYAYQESYYAGVELNRNGVFSMKIDTFKRYFQGIGVAV